MFPLDITNVSLKGFRAQIGADCVFLVKLKYDETSFTDADDVYRMSKVVGEVKHQINLSPERVLLVEWVKGSHY